MEKNDLEKHAKFLQDSVQRFDEAEAKSKYLKRKAERESEIKTMENEILITKNYLNRNDELHQIFMEDRSDFLYEEALTKTYFSRDFHRFVESLKKK